MHLSIRMPMMPMKINFCPRVKGALQRHGALAAVYAFNRQCSLLVSSRPP